MATTARTQETNESFDMKTCVNDLTKIPQKEFEAQFRNWMEKDGVARAMQAKLRFDLIANFNNTNLGKHIIGQTPTNRLTLTPMEMALNTLVAEYLFAQNCHFTLSVYSTETPFRNTLPDFENNLNNFRFKENEVTEILKAICGPMNFDWNVKNIILKNYAANKTTALLHFILKALLEKNAETAQRKVTVGTNTRPLKMSQVDANPCLSGSELPSSQQTRREAKTDFYNTNFRYLNRYLIILSRKVKEMCEQFEKLQYKDQIGQPRIRVFKSMGRRKYEDLNRSLERVTENLKQMANAKRKSRRVTTIVKAIEALAAQFQKCAENFEHVSKNLKTTSSRSKADKSTTSSELINPNVQNPSVTTTNAAASQTDGFIEKSFVDWLHEMRYTRNGQKFLDRIERSFVKALEKQKRELLAENEVKLRHQKELMKIRYKQKVIQEICSHGNQSAHRNETQNFNVQSNETISEQFRQFELKHFDLLSKIYESETEHRASDSRNFKDTPQRAFVAEKVVHFNVKENTSLPKSSSELESYDCKLTSSSEHIEKLQEHPQILKEKNVNEVRQQVKVAIGEIVAEERNVDQIVMDAKLRIKELEHESNQLTENFLGYLDRQREKKLAAREAAQSLWNDYMKEREKMQQCYKVPDAQCIESKLISIDGTSQSKELGNFETKHGDLRDTLELFLNENKKRNVTMQTIKNQEQQHERESIVDSMQKKNNSCSESGSSSYMELKNPIIQAKEYFFEQERQFKVENSKQLLEDGGSPKMDFNDFLILNAGKNENVLKTIKTTMAAGGPFELIYRPMSPLACEAQSETNLALYGAKAGESGNVEVASTSNVQLTTNWQGSLLAQRRPQNESVNKSGRREIIAAAKEAIQNQRVATTKITTNTILAAAAATTTKTITPGTITRALNKNNADGASVAEAQQEHSNNYKIKIDADSSQKHITAMEQQQQHRLQQKQQQQQFYNNKTSNIKSNDTTEVCRELATETSMLVSTVQTLKPLLPKPKVSGINGTEMSRRAVLKQSMTRMQQLFTPPHQQQQQQYQKQQIMLADVSEEQNDIITSGQEQQRIAVGKTEKFCKKEKITIQSINNDNNINSNNKNNDTTNTRSQHLVDDTDSENVVGYYKNNFLSEQKHKMAKRTAKDQQNQEEQQKQQMEELYPAATTMHNIHEQWRSAIATNRITSTTLHSIDEGNKTVEAFVDWQQIACGPPSAGQQNEAKVNADKVKVGKATKVTNDTAKGYDNNFNYNNNNNNTDRDHEDDLLDEYGDDFEKDITVDAVKSNNNNNSSPHELGEIFERDQASTEITNQAEIGELIEQSDSNDDLLLHTPEVSGVSRSASDASSIDLQLSVGVARAVSGGNANSSIHGNSRFNTAAPGSISAAKNDKNASDSGSDFWA